MVVCVYKVTYCTVDCCKLSFKRNLQQSLSCRRSLFHPSLCKKWLTQSQRGRSVTRNLSADYNLKHRPVLLLTNITDMNTLAIQLNYFNHQLIWQLIFFRYIFCSRKCQKMAKELSPQLLRAQGDASKWTVLSDQQSKIERYAVCYHRGILQIFFVGWLNLKIS